MSDISGAGERAVIAINARTTGVDKSVSELRRLKMVIADLQQQLKQGAARNLDFSKQSASADAATRSYRQLRVESDRLRSSMRGVSQANAVGIKGMTASIAATRAGKKEIEAWTQANSKAGQAVKGNPTRWSHIGNNVRDLQKLSGETRRAGLVNHNVMRSMQDGIERVGSRGLSKFELMRFQMNAINKGVRSMAFNMQTAAKKMQWTGRTMFSNITMPVVASLALISAEFIRFEKQVFMLEKVLEFKGSVESFQQLRVEVKGLAKDMGMSIGSTAGLYKDIAALGVAQESIGGWARSISEIAALGEIDIGVATEFFRTTNALFVDQKLPTGVRLEETTKIMHQFNAIADETALQLKDLADAFPEVAPVMEQMGLGADQVAASLAGMYRRGIPASEAAHALKFGMQRLLAPTKVAGQYLEEMGFAAADFSNMKDQAFGTSAIERLAVSLNSLKIEQRGAVFGELFGKRQAARMISWANDLTLGLDQVANAMADGVVKYEEMDDITSDYARALLAADSKSLEQAGVVLEGFDDPMQRFLGAMKRYKESPALQWEQLKTMFKTVLADVGAIITPTLIDWGEKFMGFLDKLSKAPPPLLKLISVVGALAAVFGPAIIALSAFQSSLAATLGMAGKLATRGFIKDVTPDKVARLLDANPMRTDLMHVDGNYMQKRGGIFNKMKGPKGASAVTAASFAQVSGGAATAEKAVDKLGDEIAETIAKLNALGPAGAASGAQLAASQTAASAQLDALNKKRAMQTGSQRSLRAFESEKRKTARVLKDELRKSQASTLRDVNKKQLFGSADAAKRSGMTQGMTYGRWFGKNADAGMKGFWKKTRHMSASILLPHRSIARTASTAKADIAATVGLAAATAKGKVGAGAAAAAAGAAGAGKTGMIAGVMAKVAPVLLKLKLLLPALTIGFGGLGLVFFKVIAVVGLVIAAFGALVAIGYVMFSSITKNWTKIKEFLEPTIAKLKEAFQKLKDAFKSLGDAFMGGILGTLFTNGLGGDKAVSDSDLWKVAAKAIEIALQVVTGAIDLVAAGVRMLGGIFSWFGKLIGSFIGFWIKLFTGDFVGALKYLVKYLVTLTTPVQWVLEKISEGFIWLLEKVIWAIKQMAKGIGWLLDKIPGINNAFEGAENFFNGVEQALGNVRSLDMTGGLGRKVDEWLQGNKMMLKFEAQQGPKEKKNTADNVRGVAVEAAEEFNDAFGEQAGKDTGKDVANNILKDFLSELRPMVREQMTEIQDELKKAFEEHTKARLQKYDDEIAAIEAVEKAEEERLQTEEYIQRRRDLLAKRSLDVQNYQRNRALAIYEGRITDVRQLDLDFAAQSKDNNQALVDLESNRQKDLTKKTRDAAKERIEIEKKAEEERLKILEEAFEKQLALILLYEPRTVAEFQNMMTKLQLLATEFGIAWPETIKTAGEYYLIALQKANSSIIEQFGWGGENSLMAWVEAFIDEETWKALAAKVEENAKAVGDKVRSGLEAGLNGDNSVEMPEGVPSARGPAEILPSGQIASSYSATVGPAEAGWRAVGKLPEGLTMNNGVISGTPTKIGAFPVKFRDKDNNEKDYTLYINSPNFNAQARITGRNGNKVTFNPDDMEQLIARQGLGQDQRNNLQNLINQSGGRGNIKGYPGGTHHGMLGSMWSGAPFKPTFPGRMTPPPRPQTPSGPSFSRSGQVNPGWAPNYYQGTGMRPAKPIKQMSDEDRAKWEAEERKRIEATNRAKTEENNRIAIRNLSPPRGRGSSSTWGRPATNANPRSAWGSSNRPNANPRSAWGTGNRDDNGGGGRAPSMDEVNAGILGLDGMPGIGADTVGGFWEGFKKAWERMRKVMDRRWYEVEDSAREALETESPSRVFFRIGVDVIDGLINGIGSVIGSLGTNLVGWITSAWEWVVINGPRILSNVWKWISSLPSTLINWLGNFGSNLFEWIKKAWDWVVENAPRILSGVWGWLSGLPGGMISQLGNFGQKLFDWAKKSFDWLKENLPRAFQSVQDWFVNLPSSLIEKMTSGLSTVGGAVLDFGKMLWGYIAGFLNDKVIGPLRGAKFIGGFVSSVLPLLETDPEKLHTGGIVTGSGEVMRILQAGEGVLPVNVMKKIGPKNFEMLRRGVMVNAPRLSPMSLPTARPGGQSPMPGGDIHISVDTFIGEEQWFKSMADKYDMKVSARKAKANGSQSRIISSYNSNERNTYR
jgi:TP901 family phage tail tape measure protein